MTRKPLVSIIIVVRNGVDVTTQCLRSLSMIKHKQVIVVDNASSDGTRKMLKNWKKYPIEYIYNRQNNGFALANNQGAKRATAPYLVFLNNDTIITQDFFTPCKNYLDRHPWVAAVQPMILFPDGTIDSIGSYMTNTGFLYHRAHRCKPDKKFVQTDRVYTLKGACMIWKRKVLDVIGLLDEDYFAYFEETELCHRACNAGFSVSVVPTTSITHLGGFTSNGMDQNFVQFHNTKNRICTYLRHFSIRQLLSIFPLHLLLTELMIVRTVSFNLALSLAMQKGVLLGIKMGIEKRLNNPQTHHALILKRPDISYYFALFTSLKDYKKIW